MKVLSTVSSSMPACDGSACAAWHVKALTANHASALHRPLICHTFARLVRPTFTHGGILPGYRRRSLARSGQVRFVSFLCKVIFGVFAALHRGATPSESLPSAFLASRRPHGTWVRWHALCTFDERPRCLSTVWPSREQEEDRSGHPFQRHPHGSALP
jgi:hypothetical protein